ncbi:MAG TPA: hypothetical protein VG838_18170 [Opitutaceae bacterium]|nr:hypothetical protein [Opitutaceae bacterium]
MKFLGKFLLVAWLGLAGLILLHQWQDRMELRGELALRHARRSEIDRLRGENQRLAAGRVSDAELESMRSDHAVVVRLRGELDALKQREQAAAPASP